MFFSVKYLKIFFIPMIAMNILFALELSAHDYDCLEDIDHIEHYRNKKIYNWAENISFTPEIVFVPNNKSDLIAIVKNANKNHKRITMMGKGHSWNPLMEGADYLISTIKLKKVKIHPEEESVTIQAGATIDDVDKVIERYGFVAPCNIVGTTAITYGGIMATGSHGSGVNCPTMSDFIEEIQFIKSNGEFEIVNEETHGADIMNAARLNLGLFGIMYKIKFKIEKSFNVKVTDHSIPIENLFSVLPNYLKTNENVEILWFPMTEKVIIKSWNRTQEPEHPGPLKDRIATDIAKWALYKGFTPVIKCLMGEFPGCISPLAKVIGRHLFPDRTWVENVNNAIHYVNEAVAFPINETEIAVPYDFNDLVKVKMGWDAMVNAAYKNYAEHKFSPNVIIHMRFLRNSNAILSPSYGNKRTCYMDYGSYYKTPGWQELVNQVWVSWSKIPGVKLHWAKDMRAYNDLDVRKMYGKDNVEKFLAIRKQFDPQGMFANDFMRNLFKF